MEFRRITKMVCAALLAIAGCRSLTPPRGGDAGAADGGAAAVGIDAGLPDAGSTCAPYVWPDAGHRALPSAPTCSPAMLGYALPEVQLPGQASQLVFGDVDQDGLPDMVVVSPLRIEIFRGHGDGTFDLQAVAALTPADHVELGDWNGDGRLDMVATLDGSAQVLALMQQPDSGFASQLANTPFAVRAAVAIDLDGGPAGLLIAGSQDELALLTLSVDGGSVLAVASGPGGESGTM